METICKCAICGNGKIIDTGIFFACDYVKSMDEKCNFRMYKNFMGVDITPKILNTLMEDGHTDVFTLTKKMEKHLRHE